MSVQLYDPRVCARNYATDDYARARSRQCSGELGDHKRLRSMHSRQFLSCMYRKRQLASLAAVDKNQKEPGTRDGADTTVSVCRRHFHVLYSTCGLSTRGAQHRFLRIR